MIGLFSTCENCKYRKQRSKKPTNTCRLNISAKNNYTTCAVLENKEFELQLCQVFDVSSITGAKMVHECSTCKCNPRVDDKCWCCIHNPGFTDYWEAKA